MCYIFLIVRNLNLDSFGRFLQKCKYFLNLYYLFISFQYFLIYIYESFYNLPKMKFLFCNSNILTLNIELNLKFSYFINIYIT